MRKLLLTLIIIPLIVIAVIISEKIIRHVSIGPFFILEIFILAFLSLFSFISLVLCKKKDKRKTITNLWISIISLVLLYLISDLVAGYFLIKPPSPSPPTAEKRIYIPDQYVHHKLNPNTTTHRKRTEQDLAEHGLDYIIRVNNVGLRGRDIEPVKKQNIYRIIMLGDSFTQGAWVEDGETFSALLEESLNARNISGKGKVIEVLNAGIDSYAPILSFLQLKKELGKLGPDLVVLNFDMSDLMQEISYRNKATYGANGEIIGVDGRKKRTNKKSFSLKAAVSKWVDRNLYISRLVLILIEKNFMKQEEVTIKNTVLLGNPEVLKHTLADDDVDRTEQWQNIFDSISKIKGYCDNHEAKFLLTIYPWGHQVSEKEWVSGRKYFIPDNSVVSDKSIHTILDFAINKNIEILNTFPIFRSYNGTSLLYNDSDMHWTPVGHRLMARALEEYLLENHFSNLKSEKPAKGG